MIALAAVYLVVVPLYDLNEEGGSILDWFGEYLQQVAAFVIIHQNLQLL